MKKLLLMSIFTLILFGCGANLQGSLLNDPCEDLEKQITLLNKDYEKMFDQFSSMKEGKKKDSLEKEIFKKKEQINEYENKYKENCSKSENKPEEQEELVEEPVRLDELEGLFEVEVDGPNIIDVFSLRDEDVVFVSLEFFTEDLNPSIIKQMSFEVFSHNFLVDNLEVLDENLDPLGIISLDEDADSLLGDEADSNIGPDGLISDEINPTGAEDDENIVFVEFFNDGLVLDPHEGTIVVLTGDLEVINPEDNAALVFSLLTDSNESHYSTYQELTNEGTNSSNPNYFIWSDREEAETDSDADDGQFDRSFAGENNNSSDDWLNGNVIDEVIRGVGQVFQYRTD